MQAEYAKSPPSHTCFASVPSNNLQLRSYMTLLGGRRRGFEFLRRRRELAPDRLFPGRMLKSLWLLPPPSAPSCNGKESSHIIFVRSRQPVSEPGGAWQTPPFWIFVRLRQEINISWGWGSPGHPLKQNFKSLGNFKIKQGGTDSS